MLECEIDDMNPQIFGVLMDRLYASGALEVYFAPVQMKKNRPGTLVTVLAPPDRQEALAAVVFRETTTIGIRYHDVRRERSIERWSGRDPLRHDPVQGRAPPRRGCERRAGVRRLRARGCRARRPR